MENLWIEVAKSSPIVAVLGVIIYVMFGYLKKKDDIIQAQTGQFVEVINKTHQSHAALIDSFKEMRTDGKGNTYQIFAMVDSLQATVKNDQIELLKTIASETTKRKS